MATVIKKTAKKTQYKNRKVRAKKEKLVMQISNEINKGIAERVFLEMIKHK